MTQIGAPDVIAATQIPFLLSDSLRTNIMLGANVPDLTDVLAASALTHDVAQLAAGLDTIVGPRGVRLSGGQRQRVALARVLVRNAQLLVLDDMTSAVDVTTEQHLWQTLRQHGTGTLVVSSHRPGIMQHADSIVVLDAGRVVAQGTLIDLLQHSPHMQRLWAEISPPERTS
jgi:ATP-binding cassette subfamily B protein